MSKHTRRRRFRSALALLALLSAGACAQPRVAPQISHAPVERPQWTPPKDNAIRVPLYEAGGTPVVDVCIANVCDIHFTVDSGAADVTVSPDLFWAMAGAGLIDKSDLIDVQKYRTAGGHVVEGVRFKMPPMSIGGHVVYDVTGSVTEGADMLLLGGSFLRRFKSFTIDLATSELVLVAAKARLQ